jgi:hypothetical protein
LETVEDSAGGKARLEFRMKKQDAKKALVPSDEAAGY